jgi:hypothetical protein
MIGKVGRFAGTALKGLFSNPATNKYMGNMALGERLLPEVLFGGIEMAMTPGDIGDKLIAGGSTVVGGGLGGLALGRLGGTNVNAARLLDMAGSIGGDMGGRVVAEKLQQGKDLAMGGKGQTPYEKLSAQDREALENMIRQDQTGKLLAELGLLPGSTQSYLYDNQGIA